MPIRAVLFDLGDTLWHFPELPPVDAIRTETVARISNLLRSWGVEPAGELRFLGRDIRLALGEADRVAYEGDLISPDYVHLAQSVARNGGLDITRQQAEQLWDTWNLGGAFLGRQLHEDAIEMLESLRHRGFRLGAVTNRSFGGPRFLEEVRDLGLMEFFDAMSISCDMGYMKPHPKIFEHALQQLGLEASESVMVGDSLRADVIGSQSLGMTAVWRRHPKARDQVDGAKPDFVVDDLQEIPSLPCFR
jgi:HAD superfamily hydrolase (TIGR01549 family)